MALITKNIFSTKKLTWLFVALLITSLGIFIKQFIELKNIQVFNQNISEGKSPRMFVNSFEARYATAYWLTTKERYKEAGILFQIFYLWLLSHRKQTFITMSAIFSLNVH